MTRAEKAKPFYLTIEFDGGSTDTHGHWTARAARLEAKRLASVKGIKRMWLFESGSMKPVSTLLWGQQ